MAFVRKALLILLTPILVTLLFATAFDNGVVRVLTHPATVKKIVADSGVYNDIIPNLLKQAGTASGYTGVISYTNPVILSAATTTFSPQFLQTTTNGAVDSIYAWLNGKTAVPNFTINLTPQKQQFAALVGQAEATKAAALPVCTTPIDTSTYDVLNATCLPYGVSPSLVSAETQNTLLNDNSGFLKDPIITADTVKSSGSNQSIFADKLKGVPSKYRLAKQTPLILALLTILVSTAIIFLSSTKRKGLKHIAIVLITIGVFMSLFAFGINKVASKEVPKISFNNVSLDRNVRGLATDLIQSIDKNYWEFGGLYVLLGALGFGWLWYDGHASRTRAKPAKQPSPKIRSY